MLVVEGNEKGNGQDRLLSKWMCILRSYSYLKSSHFDQCFFQNDCFYYVIKSVF